MKKKELIQLKALAAKTAADLTADETTTLQALQAKAAEKKIDIKSIDTAISEATDDDDSNEGSMTEADVSRIVTKAVSDALAASGGAKAANIPTAEEIATIVTKSLKAGDNMTEDKMRSMVSNIVTEVVAAGTKSPSRMEFPDGADIVLPVSHRGGNLTVAQKQLLNRCLMSAPEEALRGQKRPGSLNDGLSDALLVKVKAASDAVDSKIYGNKAVSVGNVGAYSSGAFAGTLGALATVDLSTDLQTRLYLNSELATVMMAREIQMPTDPFKLPIRTVRTPYSLGAEPLNRTDFDGYVSGGTPTLGQITLDALKMVGIASYTYEADEDSIIAVLPMLQNDLGEGAAASFETAIINGDSDGTHQDTGPNPGATDVRSAYDGFRKQALAVGAVSWASGGLSLDNFMGLRATMGKWGTDPSNLVIIVDPVAYLKMQAEDAAFRYDVRGHTDIASNTGKLPYFNGIRVIVSEQMPSLVTTAGIVAASSNVSNHLVIANLSQYIVGVRRGFTVEVVQDPRVQTNFVVASFRRAFKTKETASSTIPHTVLGVNWTS